MQISLDIKDEVYQQLVQSGVDMQEKFNEYLVHLIEPRTAYMKTEQFQEDKAYFENALREVESGEAILISHSDVWEKIEKHTSR